MAFPYWKDCFNWPICEIKFWISSVKCFLSANSTSSSEKSNSNSIREANSINLFLKLFNSDEIPPFNCFIARAWAALDLELIKSAIASVWLKSNLPFKKARLENSPGKASLAPLFINNSIISCWMVN